MWIDRRIVFGGGLSLLLNVFLVGWVIGHGFADDARRAPPPLGPGGGGAVVHQNHVKLLSPDERHRFNAVMGDYRPAIRAAREQLRARRQAVEAVIAAPGYDRAAAAAAFAALRAAEGEVAARLQAGLVEAMAELPQPARAALVARDMSRVEKAAAGGGGGEAAPAAPAPSDKP